MVDDNAVKPEINYELLVENALKDVVRSALMITQETGLPGETHFFITFNTNQDDVTIPDRLKESHPDKMTIIIQHQFWDLVVDQSHFEITLSFGGQKEHLSVPFTAITEFNDPSAGFGLQFTMMENNDNDEDISELDDHAAKDVPAKSADVVSLDTFRNKS
ncbi:MAG: ClpXP protease specificity-enhancing factor SspB [Pseudomonadota bacterium]|nr:ClpXP protease specificity-enhancing factor SspB [Pseudomonadota bacterium]